MFAGEKLAGAFYRLGSSTGGRRNQHESRCTNRSYYVAIHRLAAKYLSLHSLFFAIIFTYIHLFLSLSAPNLLRLINIWTVTGSLRDHCLKQMIVAVVVVDTFDLPQLPSLWLCAIIILANVVGFQSSRIIFFKCKLDYLPREILIEFTFWLLYLILRR